MLHAKPGFQQRGILRQKTQRIKINKGPAIKIRVRVQLPKRVNWTEPKRSVLVWVARLGTGAGGRAGAKGGSGTDCRKGPEDEAGQDREREKIWTRKQKGGRLSYCVPVHLIPRFRCNNQNVWMSRRKCSWWSQSSPVLDLLLQAGSLTRPHGAPVGNTEGQKCIEVRPLFFNNSETCKIPKIHHHLDNGIMQRSLLVFFHSEFYFEAVYVTIHG